MPSPRDILSFAQQSESRIRRPAAAETATDPGSNAPEPDDLSDRLKAIEDKLDRVLAHLGIVETKVAPPFSSLLL